MQFRRMFVCALVVSIVVLRGQDVKIDMDEAEADETLADSDGDADYDDDDAEDDADFEFGICDGATDEEVDLEEQVILVSSQEDCASQTCSADPVEDAQDTQGMVDQTHALNKTDVMDKQIFGEGSQLDDAGAQDDNSDKSTAELKALLASTKRKAACMSLG